MTSPTLRTTDLTASRDERVLRLQVARKRRAAERHRDTARRLDDEGDLLEARRAEVASAADRERDDDGAD